MTEEEALAWAIEEFHAFVDGFTLFRLDYVRWRDELNLDLMVSFVEAIKAIDAYISNSDWREICCLQESQGSLTERVFDSRENLWAKFLL